MNRKDLKTLSESYEKIFENTIADIINNKEEDPFEEPSNELSNDVVAPQEAPPTISIGINGNDGDGTTCSEVNDMNITKLRSLVAHSNKILQIIESGKEIDAWMTDKITVASENILDVSNVLEFGN